MLAPDDPIANAVLAHVESVDTAICAALAQDRAMNQALKLLAQASGWEETERTA